MASSVASSNSASTSYLHRKPISQNLIVSPLSVYFPLRKTRLCSVKTSSSGGGAVRNSGEKATHGADLLRKPVALSPASNDDEVSAEPPPVDDKGEKNGGDTWVDWEDRILEDTVPLVGFVRMILHSGRYGSGDRLSPEHESTILERLLHHHPESEKKIGCGIDYITIGYHPNFESSRCLFIVRNDGELVDFSYWKCIKGLIRKNYPLYADSFILKHFRKSRRSN